MSNLIALLADASSTITGGAGAACAGSCNLISIGQAFKNLANTLIFVVGAVAVVMIIVGGLRYVISRGDPKNVTEAKNLLLYAVIGLGVAFAAYAIVKYVGTALGAK